MSSKFDHRQFNLTSEQDAIDFLDLIVAKAPQLQKILKGNALKVQSLISRAEFAEGKKDQPTQLDTSEVTEASIGQRLSGKVTPQVQQIAQSRIEQMREAAASRGTRPIRKVQEAQVVPQPIVPVTPTVDELNQVGAAGVAALETTMVSEENDDPLNLPAAGEIGQLPVAPPVDNDHVAQGAEQFAPAVGAPALEQAASQGIDLAALAAAQNDEEEIAGQAGTSPSEHAANDGVQSENSGAEDGAGAPPLDPADTSLVSQDDLTPAGDRIANLQKNQQS